MGVKSFVKGDMSPRFRALAVFALVLGSIMYASGLQAVRADEIDERCQAKPNFALTSEIELGHCVEFANEIYSAICREVVAGAHSLGWFVGLAELDGRLVGYRCQENDNPPYSGDDRRRWGGTDTFLSEIKEPAGQGMNWTVVDLQLPGFGYFSSPSFCGTAIAYWHNPGPQYDDAYDVAVFDIQQDTLVALAEAVDAILPTTDSPAAFPAPTWGDDCRSVRFFFDRMTSPVVVDLAPRN